VRPATSTPGRSAGSASADEGRGLVSLAWLAPAPGTLLYPQSLVVDLVDVAVDAKAAAAARHADEQTPPINASFALALGHLRRPTPGSLPTMVPLSPWAGGWASVVSARGRYTGPRGVRPGSASASGPPALFTMTPIVAIGGSGGSRSSTGPYARTARGG